MSTNERSLHPATSQPRRTNLQPTFWWRALALSIAALFLALSGSQPTHVLEAGLDSQAYLRSVAQNDDLAVAVGARTDAPATLLDTPGDDLAITYEHVDTWKDVPWVLTPGRFGSLDDVTSDDSGTSYVLDSTHDAIHVIDPTGVPARLIRLRHLDTAHRLPSRRRAMRLDAAPDGTLFLLSNIGERWEARVDVISKDGTPGAVAHVSIDEADRIGSMSIVDLGVTPDGRIALAALSNYVGVPGAVLVHDLASGATSFHQPRQVARPYAIDVDDVGIVHVLQLETFENEPDNRPWPTRGPTSTPRPSSIEPAAESDRIEQSDRIDSGLSSALDTSPNPDAKDEITRKILRLGGLLIFNPDMSVRSLDPTVLEHDLAVRNGPVVFAAGRSLHTYLSPTIYHSQNGLSTYKGDSRADLGPGGLAHIALNYCRFTGLSRIEDVERVGSPNMRVGEWDRTKLAAPYHPIRLAADDDLVVLEGHVTVDQEREYLPGGGRWTGEYVDKRFLPTAFNNTWDQRRGNSVQRWTLDGDNTSRYPQCPTSIDLPTRDIARTDDALYAMRRRHIERQAAGGEVVWKSDWSFRFRAPEMVPEFVAIAADGDHVAVLDIGRNEVHMFSEGGGYVASWSIDVSAPNTLPVDIAFRGDRIYLADVGRDRIVVRGLAGEDFGEFPTHDGPWRIATAPLDGSDGTDDGGETTAELAPGDDLFILGLGGWGLRYSPDGTLRAGWSLPDRDDVTREDTDIAVASDGRVYVSYRRLKVRLDLSNAPIEITDSGIEVYAPREAEPRDPAPPELGACLVGRSKTAEPPVILLGDEVEVKLRIDGECPGVFEKAQIVVLFDTSWSMTWDNALERAKAIMLPLLSELDPDAVELALITFDDGGALEVPLTSNIGRVRARIATTDNPDGDTRMAAGIELARLELGGDRKDPDAHQFIWLVTDGVFKDDPVPAADAARAEGIDIHAFVFDTHEFEMRHRYVLGNVTDDDTKVYMRPTLEERRELARRAASFVPVDGLVETITIDDVIPDNMLYVVDSAVPPATLFGRTLTWTLDDVTAKDGAELTYRLEPLELGRWPTNVVATGEYTDALGFGGSLLFPVPEVVVTRPLFFPMLGKRSCERPRGPIDLMLLVDRSSSMLDGVDSEDDEPTKLAAAVEGAKRFVGQMDPAVDRVALIGFDANPGPIAGLTSDHELITMALDRLTTGLGTRIDRVLSEARALECRNARPDARKVVLLITDGLQNGSTAPVVKRADDLRRDGIELYAISVGDDADAAALIEIVGDKDLVRHGSGSATLTGLHEWIVGYWSCTGP